MSRPSARTEGRRTPRWRYPALLLFALLTCLAGSAGGASAPVVVTMDVPSASSLTNNCRQPAGYRFGIVQPGTPALTATAAGACSFTFDSTNDTAMLRMYQRDQHASTAMSSMATSTVDQVSGAGWRATYDIDMFDSSNGYAGGSGGRLLRTTDGTTWNTVATGLGMTIRGVEAVSATTLIAVGSSGIMRSTTNGTSWTTVYAPAGVTFHDVDEAGGQYWAVGSGGTIATSGDGIAWTPQASGVTATLESVDAVTSTVALAAGGSRILRYATGAWTTRATVDAGYEVSAFSAGGLAIATGNWGEIRRSLDGGVTWSAQLFAPPGGMVDSGVIHRGALVVSATEAYVTGTRGVILRSTDSGASWGEVATPTRNFIRELAMNPAASRFYVVGGGELVADTTDWSAWTIRRRIDSALYDVTARDAQNAYAVGAHGMVRTTTDGTSWNTPASPTTEHLWAVDMTTGGVGYAVGDNGTVLRTATGATWVTTTPVGATMLRGVTAVDSNTVVAVGLGGTIARSVDGGTTWTTSTPVASHLHSVSSRGSKVVAVGGTAVLVSSDGGATWIDRSAAVASTVPLRDVSVASSDVIYVIAKYDSSSKKSIDGGVTWQSWPVSGWGNGGYGVSAVNEDTVFAAIYSTSIIKSIDGGTTMTDTCFCSTTLAWAVAAVDSNTAFVVGEDGAIGKTQVQQPINDYGGANVWNNVATPSMFGVCLQSVTGATPDWTADASPPCTATDTDPWRSLPSAASKVAHTTSAGAVATVTVVWGVRPDEDTPPGSYQATALVEVLAPNA